MKIKLYSLVMFLMFITTTTFAATPTQPIPDTGISKCYNDSAEIPCPSEGEDFYGQDGNYSINPMSYTKLDATGKDLPITATTWAMVKDNVTGLIWENNSHESTWNDAPTVIASLNTAKFGGYSDWRLPNMTELFSIMDFGVYGPTININYFKDTFKDFYWSDSTNTNYIGDAWGVYFGDGTRHYYPKGNAGYVRAVRAGQSIIGSFDPLVINGDGTVYDTATGLMWQQDTAKTALGGTTMVWKDALAYCENLTLGGYTDWRLPTIRELRSIVDYTVYSPAIDINVFQNTFASVYWSSTNNFSEKNLVLVVYFNNGEVTNADKPRSSFYVRAVRAGKSDIGSFGTLAISPTSRSVANSSGTTTFAVSNTDTGTMAWTAAVTSGGDWLSISSGSSGSNSGTITCSYSANTTTSARTATIKVTATGATGSPQDLTVIQAAAGGETKPTVITNDADQITGNSATLKAFINPKGYETKWYFQYRQASSSDYIQTNEQKIAAGFQSQEVSAEISDLDSNTQYFFRVVAINAAGTSTENPLDFKTLPVSSAPDIKVIIVAGGGNYAGNNIWDATLKCTNAAYSALLKQGITKDRIYYLNSVKEIDPDGNGKPDDVDFTATNINLKNAIINLASDDTENMLIYMVDHGGPKTFQMRKGEMLSTLDLDSWLDEAQAKISGNIIIVYDACHSGSFLSELTPPIGKEKQRIIAASTQATDPAWFVTEGTLSFSWLFWNNVANGYKFYDSYVNAKKAMQLSFEQTAMIESNGNGIPDEKNDKNLASDIHICAESGTAAPAPEIGTVCAAQTIELTQKKATIYVENITSIEGIRRVWAIITPPDFAGSLNTENPVTDDQTISIDLIDKGNGRFSVEYDDFDKEGIYSIAVFAVDKLGYLSEPVITKVNVGDVTIKPDKYEILTDSSPACTIPSGSYIKVFGSAGANTVNVKSAARVECVNFPGANQINIEESSFQCKIKRSGATVYITGESTMSIKIPATKTAQTLRFGDGSSTLIITGGRVMLGTQEIKIIEAAVGVPVNGGDSSAGMF